MIDCVLVIVAYNSAGDIRELLDSVPDAAGALSWHVVVVNNSPHDDLSSALRPYPNVTLLTPGANLGYSGGLNAGMRAARPSRLVAFLNPDLTLDPGSISTLAAAVTGTVGAAVPAILDEAAVPRRSLRREPSIGRSLGEALFGDHWPSRPSAFAEIVRRGEEYRRPHAVDWATGAALMVSRDVADAVGDWDSERFFLYSEEIDYCRRIRSIGRQIWFTPKATVRHHESGSGASSELDALLEVNKVRYYRKWHSAASTAAFATVAVLHHALRAHRASSRAALTALVSPRARMGLPGGIR